MHERCVAAIRLDRGARQVYPHHVESMSRRAHGDRLRRADVSPPEKDVRGKAPHPLGPLIVRSRSDNLAAARGVAGAVLCGCLAIVAVASRLRPDPSGFGTHQQLGGAPCLMPMMTGYPCPTCGMTTAFALAVRGRLLASLHAQPAGMLILLAVVLAAIASASVLATGKTIRVNWYRLPPARITLGVLLVLLAGWLYKIAVFSPVSPAPGG